MEKRTENQGRMSDVEIMAIYRKDKKAGNEQMINKYSKYVYDVINSSYPTFHKEIPEMYQQGVIGIMNAMHSYDPEKGAFTTYSTPFIKKEISKHVRFIAGESSEYFASIHNSINRAKSRIETNGNMATVERLAKETGLSHKIVKREMKVDHTKVSYDVLENTPSDMSLTDSFVVNDMLSAVDELSRRIIRLKAIEGVSFTAIAKETGMTPHNVKKVYSKGIAVLRESLEAC